MRVKYVSIVATLLLTLIPNNATACSCLPLSPCEAFGSASAVFVGRMLEGSEKYTEYKKDGVTVSLEAGSVRFAVEESFKGVTATEITIQRHYLQDTGPRLPAESARRETGKWKGRN